MDEDDEVDEDDEDEDDEDDEEDEGAIGCRDTAWWGVGRDDRR